MNFLYLDYETWSSVSLRKHAVDRYAREARPLLLAYALGNDPVTVIDFTKGEEWPDELRSALFDPKVIIVAHNAWFDRNIMLHAEKVEIDPLRWWCTQAQAQAHSLPGGLDPLCQALGVPADKAKIKDGRRLLQKFCSHKKPYPETAWKDDEEDWDKFVEYCRVDVEAMRKCLQMMPTWNYGPTERKLWALDQRINQRGIQMDTDFAEATVACLKNEKVKVDTKVDGATDGAVTAATQRDKLLRWLLEEQGCLVADMRAATLETALLDENLDPATREVIELRLQGSKNSTSKYQTVLNSVGPDGRLRGTLTFAGAGRTARWAGRMFQPQNLPRPDPDMPSEAIRACIYLFLCGEHELIPGILADNLAKAASNSVRGLVIAARGKKLTIADWSNIEGRALAWLAGEAWKLDAFRERDAGRGEDLYKLTFSKAFSVPIDTVTGFQRQQGKGMELSMGYGGGVGAFVNVSAAYGLDLEALAESVPEIADPDIWGLAEGTWDWAVKKDMTLGLPQPIYTACEYLKRVYRGINTETVRYWYALEDAARSVITNPGTKEQVGAVTFTCNKKWMRIELPSGRFLCYALPKLSDRGKQKPAISYMAYRNKRWSRTFTYGGKLSENVTQAVARDVLAHSLLAADAAGFKIVLHVHDEIVAEQSENGRLGLTELESIMTTNPPWARGLPLAAEGEEARRYGK